MKKSAKQYYSINRPTDKNLETGNVCFSINDLTKFDKDFLFEQEVNGVKYSKVIPKEWVRDNMKLMYATNVNETSGRRTTFPFYVLKIESILSL